MIKKTIFSSLSFLVIACSSSQTNTTQVLKIATSCEAGALNPKKARALDECATLALLFEGLMTMDKDENVILGAAASYDVSEDGKTYTFKLKNTKWSNDDPVTSHHFVDAWKSSLSPTEPSIQASTLLPIKNASHVLNGTLSSDQLGIHAPDSQTIVIELEQPQGHFPVLLAQTAFMPEHPSHQEGISNGRFYLADWKQHDCIVLKRNPHFRETTHIDAIEMLSITSEAGLHLLSEGKIHWVGSPYADISPEVLPQLRKQGLLQEVPALMTAWLRLNTERTPLEDPAIRKALALGIHRQDLIDHVLMDASLPATSIVARSLNLIHHDELLTPHRPTGEMAETLKNNAQLTLTYYAAPRSYKIAQALQQQWKQYLGIDVKLEAVEGAGFFARVSAKDYQIALATWVGDFADPVNFLDVFKTKTSGSNNTNWENARYHDLLVEAETVLDPNARLDILRSAEKIIYNEMPTVPLYCRPLTYVQSSHLKNAFLSSTGRLHLDHAYIETDL